jgi:hypothetical protein
VPSSLIWIAKDAGSTESFVLVLALSIDLMNRPGMAEAVACLWSSMLLVTAASAQVHADIDLEGGTSVRFLSGRPDPAARNPDPGPTLVLSGRVALFPLLRAGAYVSHDFSPISGADWREITSGGLSIRLLSPWPRRALRIWLGAGFGYAAAYAPSYSTAMARTEQTPVTALISGTAGGFFEVPMSLGASARFSPRLELVGDVGARIGLGFTGAMYTQGPTASANGLPTRAIPAAGDDVVAICLLVGAAYEL